MSVDHDRALEMFRALCPDSDTIQVLMVEGEPKSKARARFGKRGRVYTPKAQRAAEEALGWHFRAAFKRPLRRNVAVGCVFYRSSRQRIDVDNMLKHVMDAANTIVWHDDSQVTAQMGVVQLDPGHPRTVIMIGEHDSTMERAAHQIRQCEHCGDDFEPANHATKYCSRKCAARNTATRTLSSATCPTCRDGFQRKRAGQRYCSKGCASRGAGPKGDPSICRHCGAQTSRREYTRCMDCYRAGKR